MEKKIGRPAYENATTRTFKLNDGEYEVVKSLVNCLRSNFSYDELNNGAFSFYLARDVFISALDFRKNLKS